MSMMTPWSRGSRTAATVGSAEQSSPSCLSWFLSLASVSLVGGGGPTATTDDQAAPKPTKVCHTPTVEQPKDIPEPAAVDVNVQNGTDQAGSASTLRPDLALVGFNVVGIGNTDESVKKGVAVVRYGPNGFAARFVRVFLHGATLEPIDQRRARWSTSGSDLTSAAWRRRSRQTLTR